MMRLRGFQTKWSWVVILILMGLLSPVRRAAGQSTQRVPIPEYYGLYAVSGGKLIDIGSSSRVATRTVQARIGKMVGESNLGGAGTRPCQARAVAQVSTGSVPEMRANIKFLLTPAATTQPLLAGPPTASRVDTFQQTAGAVVASLQEINSAERVYASRYGKGFAKSLEQLGPPPMGSPTDASHAGLIGAALASGKKSGYFFGYGTGGMPGFNTGYSVQANPMTGGRTTGGKHYYTNQSGGIWQSAEMIVGPGTNGQIVTSRSTPADLLVLPTQSSAVPSLDLLATWRTTDQVTALAFTPDGKALAAGVYGKGIQQWTVPNRNALAMVQDAASVADIAFAPSGQILASTSGITAGDKTVRLWYPGSGSLLRTLPSEGWVSSFAFSPKGQMLAVSGRTTTLWSLRGWRSLRAIPGGTTSVGGISFGRGGRLLAINDGGQVTVWDVDSGRLLGTAKGPPGHSTLGTVAISSDGKYLAAGGMDSICVWRLKDFTLARVLKPYRNGVYHAANPASIVFIPGSDLLISLYGGVLEESRNPRSTLRLWDVDQGHLRQAFVFNESLTCLALSSNGKTLAVGGSDATGGKIMLWSTSDGRLPLSVSRATPSRSNSPPTSASARISRMGQTSVPARNDA